MTASKVWIIEPRDPFIARDGKPFGVGANAATLPFPFPSTTTGGVRTRAGLAGDSFVDGAGQPNQSLIAKVKEIIVRGSLLVELNDGDDIATWFMPAPSDALLLEKKTDKDKADIKRLVPLDVGNGLTNLNQPPHSGGSLTPVGFVDPDPNKPYDKAPRFWNWDKFKEWLLVPDAMTSTPIDCRELGHNGAAVEIRTHVAIDPHSFTSLEGQLFQTRGLEFTHCEEKRLKDAKRLALAVCVEDHQLAQQIKEGLAPLGGERRIVAWRESNKKLPDDYLKATSFKITEQSLESLKAEGVPVDVLEKLKSLKDQEVTVEEKFLDILKTTIGDEQTVKFKSLILKHALKAIQDQVAIDKACRVLLLTPAYFVQGSKPSWLLSERHNVKVELKAIAGGRPQVISGWDFALVSPKHNKYRGGMPKPTRRLAPAGAVYFLKLEGDDPADIKTWVEETWMRCVSDDAPDGDKEQYRRDGFGLAAVGIWDGLLQTMAT